MKRRPSILLYFDNYHLISHLPDDQLALLFRSFMEFSEQEVNGGGASIADYQRRYPAMGETARAYFAFMADNVRRDAAVYREKCANYSAAAQRREAEKARAREERPSAPSASGSYASRRPAPRPEQDDISPYVRQFYDRKQREALQRQEWS